MHNFTVLPTHKCSLGLPCWFQIKPLHMILLIKVQYKKALRLVVYKQFVYMEVFRLYPAVSGWWWKLQLSYYLPKLKTTGAWCKSIHCNEERSYGLGFLQLEPYLLHWLIAPTAGLYCQKVSFLKLRRAVTRVMFFWELEYLLYGLIACMTAPSCQKVCFPRLRTAVTWVTCYSVGSVFEN